MLLQTITRVPLIHKLQNRHVNILTLFYKLETRLVFKNLKESEIYPQASYYLCLPILHHWSIFMKVWRPIWWSLDTASSLLVYNLLAADCFEGTNHHNHQTCSSYLLLFHWLQEIIIIQHWHYKKVLTGRIRCWKRNETK